MTAFLADANLLIAMTVVDHVHHEVALGWFEGTDAEISTCPITEGTLLRFLIRAGTSAVEAVAVLDGLRSQSWHVAPPLTGTISGERHLHRRNDVLDANPTSPAATT